MTYWLTWKTVTLPLQVAFKILKYHSPALADDISCIATFPKAMQAMMNTAYAYSCKWRFKFNADKSCILTIVAKRNKQPTEKNPYILGTLWFHLAKHITIKALRLTTKQNSGAELLLPVKKDGNLFTAYLTIISITNVNPLTMSHAVVLYGCELWNAITQEVVRRLRLNTLQHGIWKVILNLPKTNNIRYVLTAPKSHSNYGRNWCEEAPFLWKTVSSRLYSRHFKYPSKV